MTLLRIDVRAPSASRGNQFIVASISCLPCSSQPPMTVSAPTPTLTLTPPPPVLAGYVGCTMYLSTLQYRTYMEVARHTR